MRRTRSLALVLILLATPLLAPGQVKQSSTADEVIATMRAIRAAANSGDKVAWDRLVAPDCAFVEPSGRTETRAFHSPQPKAATKNDLGLTNKTESSELKVHDYGDTAVLTYRQDSQLTISENTTRSATRYTEVYKRASAAWQLIFSAETPIPLPAVIKIDPKIYDDYVGEYEISPQLIGTVYRQGDKLMLNGTGWKQPYELLPIAADTFVVKGMEQNEITFVRDGQGKVIHQSSKFRGQQQGIAKKIK
jgi:ketosteroid isomerase-like protein